MSFVLIQSPSTSGTGVSSLTLNLTQALGAGNLLVLLAIATNGTSGDISSVGSGGTWVIDTNIHVSNGTTFGLVSGAYVLSSVGGATSLNINFTASNTWRVILYEFDFSGSSVVRDSSNNITDSSSQTSQPGCVLTLTGSNDVIVRGLQAAIASVSGISAPYTNFSTDSGAGAVAARATSLNTTDGSAPTWTLGSAAQAIEGAIAFSEIQAAGFVPTQKSHYGSEGMTTFSNVVG